MQQQTLDEISMACEAIENSLTQYKTLSRLYQFSTQPLSPQGKQLLHIACENAFNVCSIEQQEISLEGLGQALLNLWDKICKAFKWIWDKITWLFKSQQDEKMTKDIHAMKEDVEEVVEKAPNNSKFDEVKYMEDVEIIRAFAYEKEKDIDGIFIINKMKKLEEGMGKIEKITELLYIFLNIYRGMFDDFKDAETNEQIEHALTKYFEFIENGELSNACNVNREITHTLDPIESIDFNSLKSKGIEKDRIDRENSRELDVLLFNQVLQFYAITGTEHTLFGYRTAVILSQHKTKHLNNRIKYFTPEELIDYYNQLEALNNTFIEKMKVIQNTVKVVKQISNECMAVVTQKMHEAYSKGLEESQNNFVNIGSDVFGITKEVVEDLLLFLELVSRNRQIYKQIMEKNLKHYSGSNKS